MLIDLDGKSYIEVLGEDISFSDKYVNLSTQEISMRPLMNITVSGSIVSNIPNGSILHLGEQEFIITDGVADIEGYSGTVYLTCFPYMDEEFEL